MSATADRAWRPAVRTLPTTLLFIAACAALTAVAALMPLDGYIMHILVETACYTIAVFGLTVVLGLCGQINLAQAAFFGFGAYAVGLGTVDAHLHFWIALALGGVFAAGMGALLGATTLKLGGHYLAMVTISFQEIVTLVLVNWIPVTHGPDGVSGIARPHLLASANAYLAFCVAALAVIGYFVWRLPQTRFGRSMRAVRDNELAASVSGISIFRTKVIAFALSALLAGIGGGLFAGGFSYVSPDQFAFSDSIVFMTMALLGGAASPIGALIGTALLVVLPELLRFLKDRPGEYLAIYGLAVILIIRFMPDGIWGFVHAQWRRLFRPVPLSALAPELVLKPPRGTAAHVLDIEALTKRFGGLTAVDGVTLSITRGGVHALIGPNGSGKTTTLNVLSGLYVASAGKIVLDGHELTHLAPHARTAAGLGRTFQNIRLFRSMTAIENVLVGAERPGAAPGELLLARAHAALAFVGLAPRAQELVTSFSYGHQRLIEIARALAGNPTLLLLDEPAAGLNSTEKLELRELLRRIAAKGLTIFIIDHDMTLVSEVAQHITVLNFGRRIADGRAADVLREPAVIEAYLGREPDAPALA